MRTKKRNSASALRQILKRVKLYSTKARIWTLKILTEAGEPLRQEQIAKRLGRNRLDKATIYRTLESFCEAGLVHKVFLQKRACYFELAHNCTAEQCHPHFVCTSCGDTHCLTEMPTLMTKVLPKGFIIRHQQVQLEGLCPQCNNANA